MFLNDNVRDSGLNWLRTNATRLHLCRQEPVTYVEASNTYQNASSAVTIGVPEDRPAGGRRVPINAVIGGTVTVTGTVTHFALTDGASVLCAVGPLQQPIVLSNGETFDTVVQYVSIPDLA